MDMQLCGRISSKLLISTGFHCALGINHHNEYNNFNLADDLIEPWRAMVDQQAYGIIGSDFNLSMNQRRELTGILHRSCKIDDKVMKISTGIELMVDSFKTAVVENQAELIKLPMLKDFKEMFLNMSASAKISMKQGENSPAGCFVKSSELKWMRMIFLRMKESLRMKQERPFTDRDY